MLELGCQLPQENIRASLWGGNKDGESAYFFLWDGVIGDDLNCGQFFEFIERVIRDEQNSDVHFLPVSIVGFDYVALSIVRTRRSEHNSLRSQWLRSQRPFGIGARVKKGRFDD